MKKVYRFYNMRASQHGEPFVLCDKLRKEQKTHEVCILQKIADKAVGNCNQCEEEC